MVLSNNVNAETDRGPPPPRRFCPIVDFYDSDVARCQAVNVIESIRDVLSRLSRSLVPTSHQVLRNIARVRQTHH
jgi:hypothetical protein